MTVFENVLIATHMRSEANVFSATFGLNRREEMANRELAMELIEMVGLKDEADALATSLPYGKQRRLEIARALATKPSLLLLDEPAAGMNPQETDDLADFICRIKAAFHLSVFVIEHHMDLIMSISDRIYVLNFGKLIAQGTPEEIQNNQIVIDAYLGTGKTN
jgi:branched-chain amino acid transport system ATP-binding protein